MLTIIGKVSYDATKDEFSITDSLGFVGGGLTETLTLLQKCY